MPKLSNIAVLFGRLYLFTCALLFVSGAALPSSSPSWQFAVTTQSKILFYDQNWNVLTASAHEFDQLTALTFDETEETLYFSDELHKESSIFSLKIPVVKDKSHIIDRIVQRTDDEKVGGIAFDPLKRKLYWSDIRQRKIYVLPVDEPVAAQVFLDFESDKDIPHGLALDICRRQLYWTNYNLDNATVERIGLDRKERQVIVSTHMRMPKGIVVDQLSDRIYWVVDQVGDAFSIESAKLDGSDRHVIVKGRDLKPLNLAVTRETIYWTVQNGIWSHPKFDQENKNATKEPERVIGFTEKVHGIVARNNFFQTLPHDQHCNKIVNEIEQRLKTPKVTRSPVETEMIHIREAYCLNNGTYIEESGICISCLSGFTGVRCEIDQCHNYCVHGTCKISNLGFPTCYCQKGFDGVRCQTSKCEGYCFNDGNCKIDANDEPTCECLDSYGGPRCEHNSTEICSLYCRILKYEPETYAPYGCTDICQNLAQKSVDTYGMPRYHHLEVCRNKSIWTSYVIISIVGGVVACLSLIAVIVHGLRRIYKPARPRIKKTFVVRKQARTNSSSDTPLTNRPLATEQCEITIENCCNMNICETPCFDPKMVEQTLSSRDSKVRVKEDKKILIHSMEDDLY